MIKNYLHTRTLHYITIELQYNFCACVDVLIYIAYSSNISSAIEQGEFGNFQSFNLDLKDTNDLVLFNSSDRKFHILGPIKEMAAIPVFTLSTFGTEKIFSFQLFGHFHIL